MRNIALRLQYDGSNYHGWQIQKNNITVQETLEKALTSVMGHPCKPIGCGRTDAGVHARCYCASFRTDSRIPVEKIPLAVNTALPGDISISAAVEAEDDFNPILSCIKKEYTYLILNSRVRDPFLEKRAYFYPSPLDVDVMKRAAAAFVGTHDFKAVRSVGTETKTTVRTVYYYEVDEKDGLIRLRVCADGFLYNMARAMAGTVIYASHGKLTPESIPELLERGDRRLTGPTVPPQGLYMTHVWYDGAVGEMMNADGSDIPVFRGGKNID